MNNPMLDALVLRPSNHPQGMRLIRLYATNPEFHALVDQLARLIPAWIDATADLCEQVEAERQEQIAALERMPLSPEVIAALRLHHPPPGEPPD